MFSEPVENAVPQRFSNTHELADVSCERIGQPTGWVRAIVEPVGSEGVVSYFQVDIDSVASNRGSFGDLSGSCFVERSTFVTHSESLRLDFSDVINSAADFVGPGAENHNISVDGATTFLTRGAIERAVSDIRSGPAVTLSRTELVR